MKDRRPVDELSIEELEEILRVRKREARLERLRRMEKRTEQATLDPLASPPAESYVPPLPTGYRRYQDVGATASYRPRALEEPAAEEKRDARPRRPVRWDWVLNKSLLVIELGLVVGLALIFFSARQMLQEINRASTQVYQTQLPPLPTPTPTPVIRVVLLPGGHTPPDAPGGPAPQEIPAHLRHLVEMITPLPVPTPGPEQAVRIVIPSIGVDAPVVEGDDWESLKRGAGHHIGSANPGESGNCIISAHNDIFGEIFRRLPEVELGSEVFIHTSGGQVYRYVVTQKRIIEPTDVSVMYPTSSPVVTLISCYPYGIDTHRIVVIGELKP
ncbi:MAG: class D sortase [Anaerolineae bacterium]|nr:class D sortase [Anaerolineae bacterium]